MSDEAHPHEIIIIKRHGGGHEDGHHGGAWKIAYADFVTAMMAFFLVMWLISANDKTKAVIARYFNPVQLVDSTSQPPGLSDPKDKSSSPSPKGSTAAGSATAADKPKDGAAETPTAAKDAKDAKPPKDAKESKPARDAKKEQKDEGRGDDAGKDEAALFKDPYSVLSEIAARDTPQPARVGSKPAPEAPTGGTGPAAAPVGQGGDAYRDPFEPSALTPSGTLDGAAESGRTDLAQPLPSAPTPPGPAAAAAASAAPLPAEPQARAAELRARIDAAMKSMAGAEPRLDVKSTPEGVLIALTDDVRFAMFASASAEPSPRLVTLMERIGRLLKAQKGRIVVRGFTDSRKFRSDAYDNWRLSAARAHMAHYMLSRGGLDDARFDRIEGYADRQPRNAKDPEAPENRRIEILLKDAP